MASSRGWPSLATVALRRRPTLKNLVWRKGVLDSALRLLVADDEPSLLPELMRKKALIRWLKWLSPFAVLIDGMLLYCCNHGSAVMMERRDVRVCTVSVGGWRMDVTGEWGWNGPGDAGRRWR